MKKILCYSMLLLSLSAHSETKMSASGASIVQSASPQYYAIKWYRASAERNAIYREIFLLANKEIAQTVHTKKLKPHQWGIIIDIDETVLDNSKWDYQHDVLGKREAWNDFAAKAESKPLPGAVQFIKNIHALGGYINLISNRPASLQAATEKNLRQCDIDFDQILLDVTEQGTSFVDKNARFNAVIQGSAPSKLPPQQVVAWLGDGVNDFPKQKQPHLFKQNPNGDDYQLFGKTYFVFPNPMYGTWEENAF